MVFNNNSLISDNYLKKSFLYMKNKDKILFSDIFDIKLLKNIISNNYKFKTEYSYSLHEHGLYIGIRKNNELLKELTNNYKDNNKRIISNNKIKNSIDDNDNNKNIDINTHFLYQKRIQTDDIDLIINFLYLEIYLLIDNFNNRNITLNDLKEKIYKYLNVNRKVYDLKEKKNRNLLISNNSSFEYPNDEENLYKYKEQIERIGLSMLEIPKNFKRNEIGIFFNDLEKLKEKLKLKKMNFNLRIKRIKKYNKNGMFILNANTIILDPREPKTIIHELGHYIYENGLAFNLNNKRVYKKQFKTIVKRNKEQYKDDLSIYSKYEDYDNDSEVFALWFENEFSN